VKSKGLRMIEHVAYRVHDMHAEFWRGNLLESGHLVRRWLRKVSSGGNDVEPSDYINIG
jgi:hypothetical protein